MDIFGRPNRSWLYIVGLLAFCLIATNFWMLSRLLASRQSLSEATDSLARSQQAIDEIARLQKSPRIPSIDRKDMTTGVISGRIEAALKQARIPSTQKKSSKPLMEFPLGQSAIVDSRYEVILQGVNMQQIVLFCQYIEDRNQGLTVRDIELNASQSGDNSRIDLWDPKITLSQLIYSP